MPSPREQEMFVRAATLYYIDGKSQAEVATELGISRSNVSRVLTSARANGIVDIRINAPFRRDSKLERDLIQKYGLKEARVAPSGAPEMQLARVGELGAQWLMDHLPFEGSIAVSWGSAVQAVVEEIARDPTHSTLEILPLVGGLSIVDAARDGNVLVRALAIKLGARHRRLYAPAVVESTTARTAFLTETSIRTVLEAASQAQVAIVGIGSVGEGASSAIIDSMSLSATELAQFRDSGAVGDCCTRYFDDNGTAVDSSVNDHVIAIDLPSLRKIPKVVGVAAGIHKAAGTHGALKGKLLHSLVVDSALATALLALD
ncbi:sugar-binding transcriptional regulator [Cryobacterium aureum]|uniref:sugar-binding transcriptional regulator n=1 Tax=Cryobacterium aureum TaxID=995037 RepID=UPI00196B7E4B|nr:sugar-binding transcriptional regulator [Cryobacterium aureum]